MIVCKELDTTFESKEDLFKALKENKDLIINAKKSQVLKSCDKGVSVKTKCIDVSKVSSEANKELFKDDNYYYIVVNTTGILDSHKDLHVNGIWNKTAKEQNRKNYLVDTHVMSMGTTIARKENVEIFVTEIPYSAIGKSYKGNTEALIYKVPKDKIVSPLAKEWLDSGDDIEASVRMQYVNVQLAMNSDSVEDKEEKANYDNYINSIANKSDFEKIDYYWIVKEAKNKGESSLVLQGSNHVTGQIQIEPSNDTQSKEVVNNTSADLLTFYKTLNS
ncbi:hypothetical protein [Tenacibaculum phage JQ]|nr:hypothetical protein [Tenacibaculum phage JQ]